MPLAPNTREATQAWALAGLFSAGVVREIASKGELGTFSRYAGDSGLVDLLTPTMQVGEAFDLAFHLLRKRHNRHEYVYKSALVHKVLLGTHSLNTATMLSEFRVGRSKADVAILNGTATVYEIKSERDNLDRLLNQLDSYRAFFPRVNVICGKNHADEVLAKVPPEVGVMVLAERFQISTLRVAQEYFNNITSDSILNSVQISEARKIITRIGLPIPCVPNTLIYRELAKLFSEIDIKTLHANTVAVLRQERSQIPLADVLTKIPASLQMAVMTSSLRKVDCLRLIDTMKFTIEEVFHKE